MEKLVYELQQKNPKALETVMDLYSGKIYYLLKRIIGLIATDEDIEEMVSDIFVAIWNESEKFDEQRGSFETFMFIKAKSFALTFKRTYERRHQNTNRVDVDMYHIPDHTKMDTIIESNLFLEKITQFIENLKEPDKSYFLLRYYLYYDLKSIAKHFKTSVKAVESSLYRTRLSLKEKLKEEGYHG